MPFNALALFFEKLRPLSENCALLGYYAAYPRFGTIYRSHLQRPGKKVKCTLVQAMRLCTGRMTHRGSTGIALLFLDHGTRMGIRFQRHAPTVLYPRGRPGTHCTGGWVGPRASLDRCGKSRSPLGFDPGPSSP